MLVTMLEFDEFLHDISECFILRDPNLWIRRVILPFSIVTKDGPVVLESWEEVRANFENYLTACDLMSIDMISRQRISVEDCGDGTWLGTYETRLLSNGGLATAPYISTALLSWEKDVLKMSSILNARGHHEWTGLTPGGDRLHRR